MRVALTIRESVRCGVPTAVKSATTAAGLKHISVGFKFISTWYMVRFSLVVMLGFAQSLATVVFGGSTAPGNGVCWRHITVIRSLNSWLLIAIAIAFISWLVLVRHALELHARALAEHQSSRRYIWTSVILPSALGLAWFLAHFFAWDGVAKDALEWLRQKSSTVPAERSFVKNDFHRDCARRRQLVQ